MKNKILVVAVHPDDETLGCGGTLLKHKANNDKIHWLICTNINKNHKYYKKRQKEINKVSKLFNFESVHNLQLETTKIDKYNISEIIEKISKVINKIKPNIIYLPFKEDVHTDHKKIFEASYSCTKSFRYPFIKKIYMMETLSETEFAPSTKKDSFIPNTFVDINKYIEKKIQIMKVFKSEIGKHPFPRSVRSIKALASFRGSTSGCKFAESFILLKEIK
ncbi:PIG-L deacetylase family protein [Candidatus Pelagibacter sp. HIMB1623]|uniref:PIG-L deacetylase family protein n=1 Tax=Candidatus Pelagibacter sp. HIMB1623 TaxID=3413358 RepID=UPI003F84D5F2